MKCAERETTTICGGCQKASKKAESLVQKFMDHVHKESKLSLLNHVVIKALNPQYPIHEKVTDLCRTFGLLTAGGDLKPSVRDVLLEQYKPEAKQPECTI